MQGRFDYLPRRITELDLDHVGYLACNYTGDVPLEDVPEFQCHCALENQFEYIVPYGGNLLERLKLSGPQLHHVAFRVDSVRAWEGLLLPEPVKGVQNMLVNFYHPDKYGFLVELVERL